MLDDFKEWARRLRRDVYALYLATRDPRVPWYAKALAGLVAVWALSPIDPIPDFIPVLGYLDDMIVIPLGICFVVDIVRGLNPGDIWLAIVLGHLARASLSIVVFRRGKGRDIEVNIGPPKADA